MKLINIFCLVLFIICLDSCISEPPDPIKINQASDFNSDVAIDWINLQRELVQFTPGYSSPVAARAYAYASMAMYESVVAGIDGNKSYSGLITEYTAQGIPSIETGKEYNWELVVNTCMAEMLRQQFKTAPLDKFKLIDQLEQKYLNQNSSIDNSIKERSIDYGNKVAIAIYNYSKTDGQDEAYLNNYPDYTVPNTPGHWEATNPNYPIPLQAYWGTVRPFELKNSHVDFISVHKPKYEFSADPKSEFYSSAIQVYAGTRNDFITKSAVEFWYDEPGISATPGGHVMEIVIDVIKIERENLAKAVEIFSKVGLSIHDAFVSAWKSKYTFNKLRPESYIKAYIDPKYSPFFKCLSYPSYPSEHAVLYAASMEVLSSYYGYRYAFSTHPVRTTFIGMPRTYESFSSLADDATWSLSAAGFHYLQDFSFGQLQGYAIGGNLIKIRLKK